MAKINWKKIATEYVKSDIAMRPLADKYGVSFTSVKDHARREGWAQQREEYRIRIGQEAVQKNAAKSCPKPASKDVDAAALIFEGATLAINWIVNRLNSGEISDYREVEALIRAMNGAKGITDIKMALEEREQRARIASLEKDTEIKGSRRHIENKLPRLDSNPYLSYDPSKCIHCMRCISVCNNIACNGTLKNGKYEFIFANLTAAMMNDEMQVQLKLRVRNSEDPGTVTDEFTYSVAEYCYKALELHKTNKKLRTLLVDLLIYGEKAQIYKEYKTDDLVTKNLTEEQLAWATAEVPELTNKTELVDGGDGTIAIKAAGLNLTDGIIVRIKIAAADIYDVELSVDDGDYYIPSDEFIPAATDGQYYAFFRIENPTQLGTVHKFTFVNADDEALSKTLKYSAESYCASILAKCQAGTITDEALQGIVEALAKYAYSVKAYASN